MQDAHRVFPLGSGREPEWLGPARARAALRHRYPFGDRRHPPLLRCPRPARPRRSRSRPSWPSPSSSGAATASSRSGGTGCTRASWWCRASRVPPADPSYSNWGLTEYAARFTSDGQVGYGMFENAVMGPHEQYGFSGWD